MLLRWFIGILVGTLLIAVTSPLFVRSYVPRVEDPTRGVRVMQPGSHYRWRSEGYATTQIGKWGMAGEASSDGNPSQPICIVLWGDSQAEGFCVDDQNKIHSQFNRQTVQPIQMLSFARSGDDCNDWLDQIETLQRTTDADSGQSRPVIEAHVFLIVELSDWCIEIAAPNRNTTEYIDRISASLPAFVIQTARNILTTGTDFRFSELRFRPGPVQDPAASTDTSVGSDSDSGIAERVAYLEKQLARLSQICDVPCIFLYAPLAPSIVAGEFRNDDPDRLLYDRFAELCDGHGFHVIDLLPAMKSAVARGDWPRGFHNGQFGVGHYNVTGNRIIAQALLSEPALETIVGQRDLGDRVKE